MRVKVWGARGSVPAAGPDMNRYGGNTSCCEVCFRDTPASEWTIGGATIRAEAVTHRGPTLGYRVTEDDTSVCYIPDHEPALGDTLTFARRTRARRLMLFHHDPLHGDDFLDRLHIHAQEHFGEAGGDPTRVEMGIEGAELELTGTSSTARTTVATEVSTPG